MSIATQTAEKTAILETPLDCLGSLALPDSDTDQMIDHLADLGPNPNDARCPIPSLGRRAVSLVDSCASCELRPGRDFVRQSTPFTAETAADFFETYRRAVRDSITTSEFDKTRPAPVPAEFFRTTIGMDPARLSALAESLPAIQAYKRDIAALRDPSQFEQRQIDKITADKNLAVSLLSVPPIMQRVKIYDISGEGQRETAEMTLLMNNLFDYAITHQEDKLTGTQLRSLLNVFFRGCPEKVRDQIDGVLQGVIAEVATYKSIHSEYRHGTTAEDRAGKDFVRLSAPLSGSQPVSFDLKCRKNYTGDRSHVLVADVDFSRGRLWIPPHFVDMESMTLPPETEAKVKAALGIK